MGRFEYDPRPIEKLRDAEDLQESAVTRSFLSDVRSHAGDIGYGDV